MLPSHLVAESFALIDNQEKELDKAIAVVHEFVKKSPQVANLTAS